jgi:peptidoglycan L-alanyl-D-glutamate endopeptidase CwlK
MKILLTEIAAIRTLPFARARGHLMSDVDRRDTNLAHLHPAFRQRAVAVRDELKAAGIPFEIFEAYRSPDRQRYLYAQGRTRPGGKVTFVGPWGSYHQYGLAADFVLRIHGNWSWEERGAYAPHWRRLQEVGQAHGLEALDFERPHLQLAGITSTGLYRGQYPADGDSSWADHLEASIVGWRGMPGSPPLPGLLPLRPPVIQPVEGVVDLSDAPRPGVRDWHSHSGGREWRCDARGVYVRDFASGHEPLRTAGDPKTTRAIWRLFGEEIAAAARKQGIAPELIVMTIATETGFLRQYGFTGMHSFRWEPHVKVTDVSPPVVGDYSAGPMQTLASTARWVIRKRSLEYEPFVVAPVYRFQPAPPTAHALYVAKTSIDIGTAVIKQRWTATDDDPILVAAAYNAGSIRESTANAWRLRSYGDHLNRAAAWYGDACAVLAESRASNGRRQLASTAGTAAAGETRNPQRTARGATITAM